MAKPKRKKKEEGAVEGQKKSLLRRIFPGFFAREPEPGMIDAASGATTAVSWEEEARAFDPSDPTSIYSRLFAGLTEDQVRDEAMKAQFLGKLPKDRIARYRIYEIMAQDPTVEAALVGHIASAFSSDTDTSEICDIESTTDKDHPIVDDLRDTFKELVNQKCRHWGWNAAVNGIHFARAYIEKGKGFVALRDDYYTHPAHTKMYEQAGRLAGFSSAYQNQTRGGNVRLMEPWSFVFFRIPKYLIEVSREPLRLDTAEIDLDETDLRKESIIEAQNYGSSILQAAYEPWFDLQEAILSMNMSRKNAARLERLIFLQMGGLDPKKASDYRNKVAAFMNESSQAMARNSLRRGYLQTIINTIIPMLGNDNKGRWETSVLEGNPNIDGLEDILFHAKRLAMALGSDLSLLGFADEQAGALGEGGWFRTSILASMKSTLIREAVATGLENLFVLHVLHKHGKYYMPGHRPWRLKWNSVSTALERENQENMRMRIDQATLLGSLIQLVDPEMAIGDQKAIMNYLFTDQIQIPEEKFKGMFPSKKPANAGGGFGTPPVVGGETGGGGSPKPPGGGGNPAFESAGLSLSPEEAQEIVDRTVSEYFRRAA